MDLTKTEESILSKALNFAVVPKSIPIPHMVAAVEDSLRKARVSGEAADNVRTRIVRVSRLPPTNISQEERRAIKNIRRNKSIVVPPADKGRLTIGVSMRTR